MPKFLLPVIALGLLLTSSTVRSAEPVDESPLPFKPVRAFPNLRLPRPIVFTHAGDGSGRVFIASQLGKVFVMPNDPQIEEPSVFLDLEPQVTYKDTENEEGLLGLAFHPKYPENGEFFIYYTTTEQPHTSVISRFRVSADDPNRADAEYEEELLRIEQPYWNHNGGGLVFGPDGYLYISLGDGGSANDPLKNGQNLGTLFGTILRIDVDRKEEGKNYAIPPDNPFVKHEGARPEIYAYGLRNVWGLSFDPATGLLYAADVGQDLWEEINIIVKGGNYGWSLREGMHRFGRNGSDPRPDLIEPIWEYNHSIGKSITGGVVYRGKKFPELQGLYLYADYITGRIWALRYDPQQKKVLANHPIKDDMMPIISFGVDAEGEVYMTDSFGMIYTFAKDE